MSFSGWGGLDQILEEAKQRKLAEAQAAQGRGGTEIPVEGPKLPTDRWNIPIGIQEPGWSSDITHAPYDTTAPQIQSSMQSPTVGSMAGPTLDPSDPWKPPRPFPEGINRPSVTPVARLKNETAMRNQYSPEATQELYDTPTYVRFAQPRTTPDSRWPDSSSAGGFYNRDATDPIQRTLTGDRWPLHVNADYGGDWLNHAMSHEFAHQWQDKHMTPDKRIAWDNFGESVASPYANERTAGRSGPYQNPTERYAHQAERGPFEIPPQVREDYYSGLYRDELIDPRPAERAAGFSAAADNRMARDDAYLDQQRAQGLAYNQLGEYRSLGDDWAARRDFMRSNPQFAEQWQRDNRDRGVDWWNGGDREPIVGPYSPENWVKERNAPQGYFEDGSAVPSERQFPLPHQWNPPQFPSMRMFNEGFQTNG